MKIKQKEIKNQSDIVILDRAKWTNPHIATVLHHTGEPKKNKTVKKPIHYTFYIENGKIYQNHAIGGSNWGQYGNLVGHTGNNDYMSIGVKGYYHQPYNDVLSLVDKKAIIKVQKWTNNIIGRKLKLIPHSDVDRTACPGDIIRAKLENGEFYVDKTYDKPTKTEIKKALLNESKELLLQLTKNIIKLKQIQNDR